MMQDYDGDDNAIDTVNAQQFNTEPQSGSSSYGSLFTDTVNSNGIAGVSPISVNLIIDNFACVR